MNCNQNLLSLTGAGYRVAQWHNMDTDFVNQSVSSDQNPNPEQPAILSTWDWGSLVDTIKKQSEAAVKIAKHDVGELGEYINVVLFPASFPF